MVSSLSCHLMYGQFELSSVKVAKSIQIICLFDLMIDVHGTQLRSCWDGQLLLPVLNVHSFASKRHLTFLDSVEEVIFFFQERMCRMQGRPRDRCLRSRHSTQKKR